MKKYGSASPLPQVKGLRRLAENFGKETLAAVAQTEPVARAAGWPALAYAMPYPCRRTMTQSSCRCFQTWRQGRGPVAARAAGCPGQHRNGVAPRQPHAIRNPVGPGRIGVSMPISAQLKPRSSGSVGCCSSRRPLWPLSTSSGGQGRPAAASRTAHLPSPRALQLSHQYLWKVRA